MNGQAEGNMQKPAERWRYRVAAAVTRHAAGSRQLQHGSGAGKAGGKGMRRQAGCCAGSGWSVATAA